MSVWNCAMASSAELRIDCATVPALPLAVSGRISATLTGPVPIVLAAGVAPWVVAAGPPPNGSPPGAPPPVQPASSAAAASANQGVPPRWAELIGNIGLFGAS